MPDIDVGPRLGAVDIVGWGVAMEGVGDKEAGRREVGAVIGLVVGVGVFGIKQTLALASGAASFIACISSTVKNS